MQALDEEMETIHLYVVREQPKKPYTALPLFGAFLCLLCMAVVTLYSAQHPYYEHERLTVPAIPLLLKVFSAQVPIIPTGVKSYPATTAYGFLTFSNGSVIGQSVPAGFTIDGATTNKAIYVPAGSADGYGVATVQAHMIMPGLNLPTLAINEVVGSSLFIRNLSPFTGGKPGYSVSYATAQDKVTALTTVRTLLAAQVNGYHYPCSESSSLRAHAIITWRCQFLTFKLPTYMHVLHATLADRSFLIDVAFVQPPERIWTK